MVFDPDKKRGFGIPKLILVEHDFDIADPRQVIWAFAGRARPSHGEAHFDHEPYGNLAVYLDRDEKYGYR